VGKEGIVVALFICIILTGSLAVGAALLTELAYANEEVAEFRDLGLLHGGSWSQLFATVTQITFLMFLLPVILHRISESVQEFLDPSMDGCADYYVLGVAALCLAATQIRSLRNAESISYLSSLCTLSVAVIFLYITATVVNPDYENVQLFGNEDQATYQGSIEALRGFSFTLSSYIPIFFIVELKESIREKRDMLKAISLSAVLQMVFYITIGAGVVINWGWSVDNPLEMPAWPVDSAIGKATNVLLFISNLISYGLASAQLTNALVLRASPKFDMHDWSCGITIRYLQYSLAPWLACLLLSVLSPNVYLVFAFVSAVTVPLAGYILPAIWYIIHTQKTIKFIQQEVS
jgi:hypothetical protein